MMLQSTYFRHELFRFSLPVIIDQEQPSTQSQSSMKAAITEDSLLILWLMCVNMTCVNNVVNDFEKHHFKTVYSMN